MALNEMSPIEEALEAVKGGTYRATFELFVPGTTTPLPMGGVNARFVIDGYETITTANGLTVATGKVELALTPEQTSKAPAPQLHWYLELTNGIETVFPARGPFIFTEP